VTGAKPSSGVPARQIPRGSKIRVALVGCGLQSRMMIDGVLCEDLVAIVDPDPARFEALDGHVAATCGAEARANYAKARRFATYQDMFDEMDGELDAVVVETPNHHHVLPAVMAMRRGIHVYLDKPLGLVAAECDLLLDEARRHPGLVTQCGTYGHSLPSMKYCADRIADGAIGEVREVWAYDDRCNSVFCRPEACPPPRGMDWDLWCGGSPVCDYYPETRDSDGMHPHGWHSWIGYGNGSVGNLGMHIMDIAFLALGLGEPDMVRCDDAHFAVEGAWAYREAFEFHFPSSRFGRDVTMHWWDGLVDGVPYTREFVDRLGIPYRREHLNIPPKVLEAEKAAGFPLGTFYKNGILFVGSCGSLWFTHHGGYIFMPPSTGGRTPRVDRPKDFDYRVVTPPHYHEFYAAIRERREANDCFAYSVPIAKTVCLANISALSGKGSMLKWDGRRVTNDAAADRLTTRVYRRGWDPFL